MPEAALIPVLESLQAWLEKLSHASEEMSGELDENRATVLELISFAKNQVVQTAALRIVCAELIAEMAQSNSDASSAIIHITERLMDNVNSTASDESGSILSEINNILGMAEEALLNRAT